MKFNLEPVKEWFGFSRRERRSSFILLLIIILVILVRYTVPEKRIYFEDLAGINLSDSAIGNNTGIIREENLFLFDPNNASYDTLLMLGLDPKEARTMINYRKSGGTFKKAQDIQKIYGIGEEKSRLLIPFIEFKPDSRILNVKKDYSVQKDKIDINTSDTALLESLPGIGPVLAVRIIKYRNLLGGYIDAVQLKEVYGLSEDTYGIISGRVIADTSSLRRININSADYRALSRHPYFEKYEVSAILKYRELSGRVSSLNDLTDNKILTPEKAAKLKPYLNFE